MAETDKAKEHLHRAEEELRDRGNEAAQAARDTARDYAQRARDEAYARGEAYRDYAAGETGKIASALRRASEDLAEGSPQERMVGRMADQVAGAADHMRGMQLNEIYDETTQFARRHPGAFMAGAALVGFAAARFLKASGHGDDHASAGALPPRGPETDRTGAARPMPDPTVPSSNEPMPAPATQPATSTGPSSPAVTPYDKKPV